MVVPPGNAAALQRALKDVGCLLQRHISKSKSVILPVLERLKQYSQGQHPYDAGCGGSNFQLAEWWLGVEGKYRSPIVELVDLLYSVTPTSACIERMFSDLGSNYKKGRVNLSQGISKQLTTIRTVTRVHGADVKGVGTGLGIAKRKRSSIGSSVSAADASVTQMGSQMDEATDAEMDTQSGAEGDGQKNKDGQIAAAVDRVMGAAANQRTLAIDTATDEEEDNIQQAIDGQQVPGSEEAPLGANACCGALHRMYSCCNEHCMHACVGACSIVQEHSYALQCTNACSIYLPCACLLCCTILHATRELHFITREIIHGPVVQ